MKLAIKERGRVKENIKNKLKIVRNKVKSRTARD